MQIVEHIENWEELAPYFSLTPAEQEEIKGCHVYQYNMCIHNVMCTLTWELGKLRELSPVHSLRNCWAPRDQGSSM